MDIEEIRAALKRAASIFKAAGARTQTHSIEAVERLIGESGDKTVEEFVEKTRAALSEPPLHDLSVLQIVERLAVAGTDKAKFSALFQQLQSRRFSKDKAIEVAARFTGARKSSCSTKPKALKAIKSKFEERAFLASKDAANSRVTPW